MGAAHSRRGISTSAYSLMLALGFFAFFFLPDLLAGRVFTFRDAGYYHLPISRVVSEELRAGRFPFWNPMVACGTPLAANPNNYVYYPSRLLDLVFSPAVALQIHFFAHWIFGAVAFAVLARRLGVSRLAAVFACAAFLVSGPVLSLLNFANLVPFLLWIPLTALALLAVKRHPTGRSALGLALCLAMQTTFVEPVFLFVELLLGVAVWSLDEPRPVPWRRVLPAGAAAAGVALLLSAPVWITLLEVVSTAARGQDWRATLGSSLSPAALLQIPVPQLTGAYHTLEKRLFWGEVFNGGRGPFFLSISVGVTMLLCAVAGFAARGRRGLLLFLLAASGVLLAMGRHSPVFAALLQTEAAGWFRWPVKFMMIPGLVLPLAAAFGVDSLRGSRSGPLVAATAVALGFAAAALWLAGQFGEPAAPSALAARLLDLVRDAKDLAGIHPEVRDRFLRAALIAATCAALFAAALFGRGRESWARGLGFLLLAVLAVEMLPPQRDVNRGTPLEIYRADPPTMVAAREVANAGYRVWFPTEHWASIFARQPGMPDEWWPRVAVDREQGNFYHPIGERIPTVFVNPDRLVGWSAAERGRVVTLLNHEERRQLAQLLGVGARVAVGHAALQSGAPLHASTAGWPIALVVDPTAPKIVRWLDELATAPEGDVWDGPFVRAWSANLAAHRRDDAIEVRETQLGYWSLRTTSPRSGWVAVTESRDPGWSARIDGESVDVEPYMADFFAVRVPEGTHDVEFRYRPVHYRWWLALSALGAGWALWLGRRG